MEHLVLTGGARPGVNEDVPYYAKENYKNVPFADYLKHDGSEWILIFNNDATVEQATTVFQTWLFFALFQEVLTPRFFRHEHYVCTRLDARGIPARFVTTERLISDIEAWRDNATSQEIRPGDFEHISNCICRTNNLSYGQTNVDRNVAVSIHSVATVLAGYVQQVFGRRVGMAGFSQRVQAPDLELMVRQRWCPFEAAQAWMSFRSVQTQMLLRTSRRTFIEGQSHVGCSVDSCVHASIPADFTPRHVSEGCCCPSVAFGPEDYAGRLTEDRICVLEVTFESDGSGDEIVGVELIGVESSCDYTAISHVWADGLSNACENSLPRCRVEAVARKTLALMKHTRRSQNKQSLVRIWLDVLCCPVNPPSLRRVGIQQLREVYEKACAVLVLDSQLEAIDRGAISDTDLAVQVLSSRWVRRLWTLQEAVMATKLWVRLSNSFIELTDLREKLFDLWTFKQPTLTEAYADAVNGLNGLRHSGLAPSNGFSHDLSDVARAVCLRSVSVPSDEALCIGTLLGKQLPFLEDFEGQNMAEIWKACASESLVYSDVIFHEARRLQVQSCRWAPKSLLYSSHRLHPSELGALGNANSGGPVAWDPRGLQVEYRGVTASAVSGGASCKEILDSVRIEERFRVILFYDERDLSWWSFKLLLNRQDAEIRHAGNVGTHLAIIRKAPNPATEARLLEEHHVGGALLAWVDEELDGKVFVRSITPGIFWKHGHVQGSRLSRVILENRQPSAGQLIEEIEKDDLHDYDLRMHGLTDRRRREQPSIVGDYAEWLLTRAVKRQYLVCASVWETNRTWIID